MCSAPVAAPVRDSVRLVLQELLELEVAQRIGAARYERTDSPCHRP
jgi:hypothetical protein